MVKQERVSKSHKWLAFVPFTIITIWAYYRIKSLRRGILPILASVGIGFTLGMILPFPYSLGLTLIVGPIPLFITLRKWSNVWNSKLPVNSENS